MPKDIEKDIQNSTEIISENPMAAEDDRFELTFMRRLINFCYKQPLVSVIVMAIVFGIVGLGIKVHFNQ